MEPQGLRLAYRVDDGSLTTLERTGFSSFGCQDFALSVEWTGEELALAIEAIERIELVELTITFAHDFLREGILMNGYQSWTDTREYSALSTMPGLTRAPKAVIDRYVLDGGGDYRFVEYSGRPGYLHGFTYAAFNRYEDFALVASLDESRGFTLIRTDPRTRTVTLEPELPARPLEAGERCILGHFAIITMEGDDVRDRAYDRWFELAGITPRPAKPLVGYSSWYRHYDDIDAGKIVGDLAGVFEAISSPELAGLCGSANVAADPTQVAAIAGASRIAEDADVTWCVQVDDGWCTVGDWLLPHEDRFPDGMQPVAKAVRKIGFTPGLWLAPFVCSKDSRLYAEHPEWLLRDAFGEKVSTGSHWNGAFALDTRIPEVRDYVRRVIRTAVEEWGFGLLKLDFLYGACMIPHDGLNRGQLMADAIDLLREAAGDALLLACGVPLASVFGKVEYCRVGCDVGLDWNDRAPMRLLHRERVSTKNSLMGARARSPLDGRAFGADPDIVFLREDVKLTKAQRKEMHTTAARCGSVLMTSDDMGSWSSDQRKLFARIARTIIERKRS